MSKKPGTKTIRIDDEIHEFIRKNKHQGETLSQALSRLVREATSKKADIEAAVNDALEDADRGREVSGD